MKNNTILTLILTLIIAVGVYILMFQKAAIAPVVNEPSTSLVATSTETPPTTNTKVSLLLESTGLGSIKFGASEEEVITAFNRVLGTSTRDTDFISSFSEYGTCPGKQIRVVEWNRLRVFFGDTQFGTKKFFQYEYTDRDTKNVTPLITTERGLTLNSTKTELQKLYPGIKITDYTENYAQYELFSIDESLKGKMKAGIVSWINAGVECAE